MPDDYSKTRIQLRRGTSSAFSSANPTLGEGEPSFDTTTKTIRVGDGSGNWNDLPNHVISDTTGLAASGVFNIVIMSSANYTALSPKDPNTIYYVV